MGGRQPGNLPRLRVAMIVIRMLQFPTSGTVFPHLLVSHRRLGWCLLFRRGRPPIFDRGMLYEDANPGQGSRCRCHSCLQYAETSDPDACLLLHGSSVTPTKTPIFPIPNCPPAAHPFYLENHHELVDIPHPALWWLSKLPDVPEVLRDRAASDMVRAAASKT